MQVKDYFGALGKLKQPNEEQQVKIRMFRNRMNHIMFLVENHTPENADQARGDCKKIIETMLMIIEKSIVEDADEKTI